MTHLAKAASQLIQSRLAKSGRPVLLLLIASLAACGSEINGQELKAQAAADNAFSYALGNPNARPDDARLAAMLEELHDALGNGSTRILSATTSRVEGLAGSTFTLYGSTAGSPDVTSLIDAIAAGLARQTAGADAFFSASRGTVTLDGKTWQTRGVDPETAQLTQDLTGSAGATAAAFYSNTLLATTAVKWPTTPLHSSTGFPAGQVCSSRSLPAGAIVTGMMAMRAGGFWSCVGG